ncbi:hypothetical protein EfmAA290_30020 (plasmid) [Enterococcus faecium]|nr:hypothetical protein EfmAA290_30020 [Enterococcus faecium]
MKGVVSAAQELYENTLITDIHTAAKVYGNTEDTAVYQDAKFMVIPKIQLYTKMQHSL